MKRLPPWVKGFYNKSSQLGKLFCKGMFIATEMDCSIKKLDSAKMKIDSPEKEIDPPDMKIDPSEKEIDSPEK
ncbi:hypothetical protein [Marinifilum flexuosum]|uniref:hypothetical protein n=1 Tax=Marinifilum flexuosum TaxID=1117708 RepID=UPI00147542E2|nr:hypothetical protein [Marinifilum flexuosum]